MTDPKMPPYIQVRPNRFQPVELCTPAELDDAAIDRAGQARDLIEQVGLLLVRAQTLRGQPKD